MSQYNTSDGVRRISFRYHCHCCNRISQILVTKEQRFGCTFCSAIIFPASFDISPHSSHGESVIMLYDLAKHLQTRWSLTIEQLAPPLPDDTLATAINNLDDEEFQEFYGYLQNRFDDVMNEIWNVATKLPMLPQDLEALAKTDLLSEKHKSEAMCCICAEDLKEGEGLLKLPCGHLHHENCLKPWLESHSTCPVCRRFLRSSIF